MATCDQEIHVGDIGTDVQITLNSECSDADIANASVIEMYMKKPDGTTITRSCQFVTDGTDGKIRYYIAEGDLDQSGTWKIQARVVTPAGEWWSSIAKFKVYANL